jgi:hypothetical protein
MTLRGEKSLALLCLCGGAWFFILAAYSYFSPVPDAAFCVVEADREVTDGYPGQKRELVFRLENRYSRPISVVGVTGC